MIKCPQCNYHNVDDHRFCQQCGTSLTQKTCASCGHLVALDATHCPQCNHPTATIWWTLLTSIHSDQKPAIVDSAPVELPPVVVSASGSTTATDADLEDDPSTAELLNTIEKLMNQPSAVEDGVDHPNSLQPQGSIQTIESEPRTDLEAAPANLVILRFLEDNPRYQLLDIPADVPLPGVQSSGYKFQILDTQPFHMSPLAVMLNQLQGATNAAHMSQPGMITNFLEAQPLSFPSLLEPYLALRQQFPLLLPYVHDAWQSEQQAVVLLENRTELPTLKEVLTTFALKPFQILHWLQQTLDFAVASAPWYCFSSVLHRDNLRVDQGQILCLQQLLFGQGMPTAFATSKQEPTVPSDFWGDLRQVWLDLLQGLETTLAQPLQLLLTNLQLEGEATLAQLQGYLSELNQQLSSATITSPVDLPLQSVTLGDDGATPTLILPNQLIYLDAAGQTDDGRDRHHNEDFFVIEQQLQHSISPHQHQVSGRGLYILCDGMGGHASGEIASSLAATTLSQYFKTHWQDHLPDADRLKQAIYAANQAIFQLNEEKAGAGSNRMGTTAIVALVQDTHIQVAHVGDSRLYRLTHQQGLEQLTIDHEVGQREIKRGAKPEVAYARPDAYQLTQALGPREDGALRPDVQLFSVSEDTLWLICSDGLTDNQLLETYCDRYLLPMLNAQVTLQQGVNELVALANTHNGHDNITVIAILMKVQPQIMPSHE
ncbi:MAG: serine/threonine phosphatase [Acaryochloris sp. RU_4_1]|nr:serine/threonine phosphatase [Acaryochloris sp. RU_4_1]